MSYSFTIDLCSILYLSFTETYDAFHSWSVEHYPELWEEVWEFTQVKYSQNYTQVITKVYMGKLT